MAEANILGRFKLGDIIVGQGKEVRRKAKFVNLKSGKIQTSSQSINPKGV